MCTPFWVCFGLNRAGSGGGRRDYWLIKEVSRSWDFPKFSEGVNGVVHQTVGVVIYR